MSQPPDAAVQAALKRAFAGSDMKIKVSALRSRLQVMLKDGPNSVRDILEQSEFFEEDEPYLTDKHLSIQTDSNFSSVDAALRKVISAHACAVLEVARTAKEFSQGLWVMLNSESYANPNDQEGVLKTIGPLYSQQFQKACDLLNIADLSVEQPELYTIAAEFVTAIGSFPDELVDVDHPEMGFLVKMPMGLDPIPALLSSATVGTMYSLLPPVGRALYTYAALLLSGSGAAEVSVEMALLGLHPQSSVSYENSKRALAAEPSHNADFCRVLMRLVTLLSLCNV